LFACIQHLNIATLHAAIPRVAAHSSRLYPALHHAILSNERACVLLGTMDSFQQCVEDLGTIGRMLELPHGRDIAIEMLRELTPYLTELSLLNSRDPTGAVKLILEYAGGLQTRLKGSDPQELGGTRRGPADRVA
jgi:hypothetical protein